MSHIQQRIAELEQRLEELNALRAQATEEQTLYPGSTTPEALRENHHREENRRQGLLAIDQSIDGAQQQLAFYREQFA